MMVSSQSWHCPQRIRRKLQRKLIKMEFFGSFYVPSKWCNHQGLSKWISSGNWGLLMIYYLINEKYFPLNSIPKVQRTSFFLKRMRVIEWAAAYLEHMYVCSRLSWVTLQPCSLLHTLLKCSLCNSPLRRFYGCWMSTFWKISIL